MEEGNVTLLGRSIYWHLQPLYKATSLRFTLLYTSFILIYIAMQCANTERVRSYLILIGT